MFNTSHFRSSSVLGLPFGIANKTKKNGRDRNPSHHQKNRIDDYFFVKIAGNSLADISSFTTGKSPL